MELALIYARSDNYCIGAAGALPWHLPDEFAHFMATTTGAAIVMGRRSYEDHNSAIPGRLNIVLTRQDNYLLAEGVRRAKSLDHAIQVAAACCNRCFIVGGANLLAEALSRVDVVYESVVHADISGDTFVDHFDFSDWHSEVLLTHTADTTHAHGFTIYRHN